MDNLNAAQMGELSSYQEGMSIKELFHILKTRLWWIILAFILVMGAAGAYLRYVTPMYESEVTILVESLQKSSDFESMLLSQGTAKIATEVEFILSRTNIQNALKRLDLTQYVTEDGHSYAQNSGPGNVKSRTNVVTVKDTNIVRITVTDKVPAFARDFANALAESYNELLGGIARNTKSVQKEFIQSQIPINMDQLREAADQLAAFREESKIMQLSDKSKLLSEKIAYFQLRREPLALELGEALIASDVQNQVLTNMGVKAATYEQTVADEIVQSTLFSYKERLRELILYESIQQGQTESPDRLFVLQSALSHMNKTLLDRLNALVTGAQVDPLALLNLQNLGKSYHQRAITEAQIEVLQTIESTFTEELGGLPLLERRLLDLERDVQVYETLRLRLMELLEEVKIAEAAVARSVTVVDPAIISANRAGNAIPVSPKKMLILAVAVLLGIALGVLLALLIEMLDITIKDEGILRRLAGSQRPMLGWIPLMVFNHELEIPSLVVHNDPLSFEAERYKLIANNISYGSVHSNQRIFSITSPGMGEGKTTVSANIGVALAMNGQKVLLVDGDLRLPQLANFFGLEKPKLGLVDVIADRVTAQEVIIQPLEDVQTLHFMPVGSHPPLPSAVFNAPGYGEMLELLLTIYDFIIVDTPPLIFASELMAIARHADGIAINVRAGISTKGGLRELLDNLDLAGTNILGVIFNGVIESKMSGYYSQGRYYTYQGSRYYGNRYNSSSRPTQSRRVKNSYRRNFLKDIKRREKTRSAKGEKVALYPFLQKRHPFEVDPRFSSKTEPPIEPTVPIPDEAYGKDWLSLIEKDPRAKGQKE
ncbi:MAG: GumC family protein [Sphaerochaetaceae bacterium]